MILYINPISETITLTILDHGEVRHTSTISKGRDYDEFPEEVVRHVDTYQVDEIWCLVGPGAFTRMRIVTLALNALTLTRDIRLKGCHLFDIIDTHIPILRANDREYIIANPDSSTLLIGKGEIPAGTYCGYGDTIDFTGDKVFVEYTEDFPTISRRFGKITPSNNLVPIYLKEPHITWSKKHTSHS